MEKNQTEKHINIAKCFGLPTSIGKLCVIITWVGGRSGEDEEGANITSNQCQVLPQPMLLMKYMHSINKCDKQNMLILHLFHMKHEASTKHLSITDIFG